MTIMTTEERTRWTIDQARKHFNEELHSQTYTQVHADSEQLRRLLSLLAPKTGQVFVDLGTGNGYVGRSLARQSPGCSVIGLDIADIALQRDVENARKEGLLNIRFQRFDGIALPFVDGCLDGVICRYAFHHFPEYERMLDEISRTVRTAGRFVLSDPVRSDIDTTDFINRFQALRQDGHVRIHTRDELLDLVGRHGFEVMEDFESTISFSREWTPEYDALLDSTPPSVLGTYTVKKDEQQIWITFDIMNLAVQKKPENSNKGTHSQPGTPHR